MYPLFVAGTDPTQNVATSADNVSAVDLTQNVAQIFFFFFFKTYLNRVSHSVNTLFSNVATFFNNSKQGLNYRLLQVSTILLERPTHVPVFLVPLFMNAIYM